MSRNYSPKTFLRQTPNHMLKEYFSGKELLGDIGQKQDLYAGNREV
ncbi:hypothetical protein L21SP3_01445 [Sedimentisphaera cyanobacteriorum]|uniref:Uncharacterized protein n=1 Tax=Sedimentisphaera cyanobacteriorum TaxID=1940790 RepID=A0A1Q2HQB3_9BACT|nr:hypothetical protein [Sedimentisphaera cyanobacteriorum]AQQ09637.1 hypothetical protein L21SP3_01445 [Sedimentisphaera cyanobacteriorum]